MPHILSIVFLFCSAWLLAQTDSILLRNDNYIVGEVKSMERGVLTVETSYSDKDFKIEWDGVKEIYTQNKFLIILTNGRQYNGPLESIAVDSIKLLTFEYGPVLVAFPEIVFLKEVDEDFWSRLYYSIDLGFNLARAQDLRQLDVRSNLGYLARRWSVDATYNTLRANQQEVEPTRRTDGSLIYRYVLPKTWFLLPEINFLSNTEQKLNLRTTGKLGLGKYLTQTNRNYWGVNAGVSFNYENFSTEDLDRRSLEGYFGSELNLYDIGDLNLLTRATLYPSFTESGRWRFDFIFDAKYDLPLDFYIKAGLTLNFDNQAVESAGNTDYVLQTGFGWEW